MKIIDVKSLAIPEIKVIRFHRYADERGYFTEIYRESDFIKVISDFNIKQASESKSTAGVLRGLHLQWNPYMGKLIRTLYGHMIDFILDVRLNSPTKGKIVAYDMPADKTRDFDEWIWVPVGFAHGNFYVTDSAIEYLVTSEYNPETEAGINPLSSDIDWSLCDKDIVEQFNILKKTGLIQSDKDKKNYSLKDWLDHPDSKNFQ